MASIPWDQLEHSVIVLDYSKLLVTVAVHGATLAGLGTLFGTDWVPGSGLNGEKKLDKMIKHWRSVLNTLTEEQKESLERQKPGVLANMDNTLQSLENRLSFLSLTLASTPLWQRVLPRTEIAGKLQSLQHAFQRMHEDFTATTRHLYDVDPVPAVLAADAAATAMAVEMANMPPEDIAAEVLGQPVEALNATPAVATQSAAAAVDTNHTPLHIPREVVTACRSTIAATAALLPVFLSGGSRARPPLMPL